MEHKPSSMLVALDNRGVIRLSGADARSFLNGLITNDMDKVSATQSIYAALLTPQGKFLFDFFIGTDGADLLLDVEEARADQLIKRLTLYKLRADVTIIDERTRLTVWAGLGALEAVPGTSRRDDLGRLHMVDPRHAGLGTRIIAPKEPAPEDAPHGTADDYNAARLALGIPLAPLDLQPEKSFLLECNFEELHGVDFKKGCYVGQELTARTKHRSAIKRRILPLDLTGALPEPGTPITAEGREIGTVTSGHDGRVLALIRLERWREAQEAGQALDIAGQEARVTPPDWIAL